jgi:disulfide bond formation protein DsbB
MPSLTMIPRGVMEYSTGFKHVVIVLIVVVVVVIVIVINNSNNIIIVVVVVVVVIVIIITTSSYDRSTKSSTASSPHSANWRFLFQFPISSHFLKDIQWMLTSSSPSFSLFHLSFNNVS